MSGAFVHGYVCAHLSGIGCYHAVGGELAEVSGYVSGELHVSQPLHDARCLFFARQVPVQPCQPLGIGIQLGDLAEQEHAVFLVPMVDDALCLQKQRLVAPAQVDLGAPGAVPFSFHCQAEVHRAMEMAQSRNEHGKVCRGDTGFEAHAVGRACGQERKFRDAVIICAEAVYHERGFRQLDFQIVKGEPMWGRDELQRHFL